MLYTPSLPASPAPLLPMISHELQSPPTQPARGILRVTEPGRSTQGRSRGDVSCSLYQNLKLVIAYSPQNEAFREIPR